MRRMLEPMEPGHRTRLVTIQFREDGDGEFPTDDWTSTVSRNVWMSRWGVGAQERYAANQLSGKQETRWEMGYRADMDPDLVDVVRERRLVYQGRTYDIVAAEQVGQKEGISLVTLAKVG